MATSSTPPWDATHNGLVGQADAFADATHVNQLLGTHADTIIYTGTEIITPTSTGFGNWDVAWNTDDFDQPFVMSGTSIGRVVLPLLCTGTGADLLVSLCADNAGQPGTVIMQTRVPASWLAQLGAIAAVAEVNVPNAIPILVYTGNPLATGQFNNFIFGSNTSVPWPSPTSSSGGMPAGNPQSVNSGTYYIQLGGTNSLGNTVADVFTIPYLGGTVLGSGVPQPSMPAANNNACFAVVTNNPADTANTLVIGGGGLGGGNPFLATVYTAAFNITTGNLTAWSTGTSLPAAIAEGGSAAWNDYVYFIGGVNNTPVVVSTIYYTLVQNNQITAWSTSLLPVPLTLTLCCVCNGFLFVIGGQNSSFTTVNTVYYAPLDPATGAPGSWQQGPNLPANAFGGVTENCTATPYGIVVNSFNTGFTYTLGVTTAGPGTNWTTQAVPVVADTALFSTGTGLWQWFTGNSVGYSTTTMSLTPQISVPLPATGLTNGSTYHVQMQQFGGDLNDYLQAPLCTNVTLPGSPRLLRRNRVTGTTWNTIGNLAMPISVYSNTVGGTPLHTWEDGGARISTLVYDTTPDRLLMGVCEATANRVALNANAGFESGSVSPWLNGASSAFGASTTFAYEGKYSAKITPDGTSTMAYIGSEHLPCQAGQSFIIQGWVYAPLGISGAYAFSMSVNWYNSAGTFISVSTNFITIPVGAWTFVKNTFTAPALTFTAQLSPAENGTPPITQVYYVDDVWGYVIASAPQTSGVTMVTYGATWPSPNLWPPTGTVELA